MQDSLEILTTSTNEEDSIAHYGVRGMRWGHRKALAKSMGISRKQLRKQIKADNREAFRLGQASTIADRMLSITNKKENRAIDKSLKGKEINRKALRMARAYTNIAKAEKASKNARALMEQHRKYLEDKYGAALVSDIKRDKQGRTNERINRVGEYTAQTKNEAGLIAYRDLLRDTKKQVRMVKK